MTVAAGSAAVGPSPLAPAGSASRAGSDPRRRIVRAALRGPNAACCQTVGATQSASPRHALGTRLRQGALGALQARWAPTGRGGSISDKHGEGDAGCTGLNQLVRREPVSPRVLTVRLPLVPPREPRRSQHCKNRGLDLRHSSRLMSRRHIAACQAPGGSAEDSAAHTLIARSSTARRHLSAHHESVRIPQAPRFELTCL